MSKSKICALCPIGKNMHQLLFDGMTFEVKIQNRSEMR